VTTGGRRTGPAGRSRTGSGRRGRHPGPAGRNDAYFSSRTPYERARVDRVSPACGSSCGTASLHYKAMELGVLPSIHRTGEAAGASPCRVLSHPARSDARGASGCVLRVAHWPCAGMPARASTSGSMPA
jgi:hypothetical protein